MSEYDALLAKWRRKLADGAHEDCMHSSALQPGSFCTVFDMCWGGPGCGMVSMLAPEYFDTPADFIAFVRTVELPRSLEMQCRGIEIDEAFPPAEAYLDSIDAESRALAEATIAAADAPLSEADVAAADAQAVVAAFNSLFGRRGNAQFIAAGDVTAIFGTDRIADFFDAWSEDADDILDADEPEMVVKRLIDSGEFDPTDRENLELARDLLAGFPNC